MRGTAGHDTSAILIGKSHRRPLSAEDTLWGCLLLSIARAPRSMSAATGAPPCPSACRSLFKTHATPICRPRPSHRDLGLRRAERAYSEQVWRLFQGTSRVPPFMFSMSCGALQAAFDYLPAHWEPAAEGARRSEGGRRVVRLPRGTVPRRHLQIPWRGHHRLKIRCVNSLCAQSSPDAVHSVAPTVSTLGIADALVHRVRVVMLALDQSDERATQRIAGAYEDFEWIRKLEDYLRQLCVLFALTRLALRENAFILSVCFIGRIYAPPSAIV